MGAFARVAFQRHQIIGNYSGHVVTAYELSQLKPKHATRIMSITDQTGHVRHVDADPLHYCGYINHQWRETGDPIGAANVQVNGDLNFQTLRDIRAGEELFFDYGVGFWTFQKKGIDIDNVMDVQENNRLRNEIVQSMPNLYHRFSSSSLSSSSSSSSSSPPAFSPKISNKPLTVSNTPKYKPKHD